MNLTPESAIRIADALDIISSELRSAVTPAPAPAPAPYSYGPPGFNGNGRPRFPASNGHQPGVSDDAPPGLPDDVQWRVTKKGTGWTCVWHGMVDDKGASLTLLALASDRGDGYGACAFDSDGLMDIGWHNGATSTLAVSRLLSALEGGPGPDPNPLLEDNDNDDLPF